MSTSLFDAMIVENNHTFTANGMPAYESTLNSVLDLFSNGASLRSNPSEIISLVEKAYNEDKNLTLRCVFYLRDIRGNGGQGERAVFRKAIRRLAELDTDNFIKSDIISFIPTYGRWDDIFDLFDVNESLNIEILKVLSNQLENDIKAIKSSPDADISILAKWLPSCNTSSEKSRKLAKRIYKSFGISEKVYRKTLSLLRKRIGIIERNLSEKDYSFNYSTISSNANLKYRSCFMRNDAERYKKHIEDVANALKTGDINATVKDNVRTLYPYEIVSKIIKEPYMPIIDRTRYNNLWMQLPNYFGEESINKNWLTVVDTSGSMTCSSGKVMPIDVAISLGLYIGERNKGIFKDKYITFSTSPRLINFGNIENIFDRVRFIYENSIISDTNIEAVFDLILNTATKHKIPASEMPEGIFIISDMQFNAAVEDSDSFVYQMIQNKYKKHGYKAPKIIFWDVAQRNTGNLPVTKDEKGTILVNGCKPGMFETLLSGNSPEDFMKKVLNSERYSEIRFVD